MEKKYYKIVVIETGRNTLKDEPRIFNEFERFFEKVDEAKNFVVGRCGKIPKGKLYADNGNGAPEQVGYHYSFWNGDVSHGSKKWFQTDWIEITQVSETPVLF